MGKYSKLIIQLNEIKSAINIRKIIKEVLYVLNEDALWKDRPRKSYNQRLKVV